MQEHIYNNGHTQLQYPILTDARSRHVGEPHHLFTCYCSCFLSLEGLFCRILMFLFVPSWFTVSLVNGHLSHLHLFFFLSQLLLFQLSHLLLLFFQQIFLFQLFHLFLFQLSNLFLFKLSNLCLFQLSNLFLFQLSHLFLFQLSHLFLFQASRQFLFQLSNLFLFQLSHLFLFLFLILSALLLSMLSSILLEEDPYTKIHLQILVSRIDLPAFLKEKLQCIFCRFVIHCLCLLSSFFCTFKDYNSY